MCKLDASYLHLVKVYFGINFGLVASLAPSLYPLALVRQMVVCEKRRRLGDRTISCVLTPPDRLSLHISLLLLF